MRVGTSFLFNNANDQFSDQELYRDQLHLVDLVEPLGFDSVWGVEHHFTDYSICPDILQFLTWVAARTEAVQLGTQVVVLPWHDPLRVAEQVSLIDTMSQGRFLFGFGRGAARVEFDTFGISMEETRQRYLESAEMIIQGLQQGYCEYEGEFIKQPHMPIRPAPYKSWKNRIYSAAVSPESMAMVAKLGVGMLVNPIKPWDQTLAELYEYRCTYREVQGAEPPPPIATTYAYVHADADHARETSYKFMGDYYRSAMRHYEFGSEHFKTIKGYEFYGKQTDTYQKVGEERILKYFTELQAWGTPDQVIEKVLAIQSKIGYEHVNVNFAFGHLPTHEVEASMRLFADEVMPTLKQVQAAIPT